MGALLWGGNRSPTQVWALGRGRMDLATVCQWNPLTVGGYGGQDSTSVPMHEAISFLGLLGVSGQGEGCSCMGPAEPTGGAMRPRRQVCPGPQLQGRGPHSMRQAFWVGPMTCATSWAPSKWGPSCRCVVWGSAEGVQGSQGTAFWSRQCWRWGSCPGPTPSPPSGRRPLSREAAPGTLTNGPDGWVEVGAVVL